MKDFLSNKLSIGDKVLFWDIYYEKFTKGTITQINEKNNYPVLVEFGGSEERFHGNNLLRIFKGDIITQ